MSQAKQIEIDALLNAAEARGTCLIPPNRAIKACLRRRLNNGGILKPYRGIFIRQKFWDNLNSTAQSVFAMRALSTRHPSWIFCGPSAAVVHGLYVCWHLLGRLHVLLPSNSCSEPHSLDGIVWHHGTHTGNTVVSGIRVTSLIETAADCLCGFPFLDGLGIADSWMRFSDCPKQQMLRAIEQLGAHKPGIARARLAARNVNPLSENGGESRARAMMMACGYVQPELQVEIPDPIDGGNPKRVDYLWRMPDGTRVAGELDGAIKYRDPTFMSSLDAEKVRERERLRESRIAMPGTSVLRFSIADVNDQPRFCRLLDSYGIPRTPASVRLARRIRRADRVHPRYCPR